MSESLFADAKDPRRRAGASQILRASVERCRREGKHLEWVDVDDLATILDALADAEHNLALCAADTSYADLRQEIELLRSTVEHERERWEGQTMYHGPKTLGEVAETFTRIVAAIPGEPE